MDIIPKNEVCDTDKRNTKKMLLPTDGICVDCGIIFNIYYEESCTLCGEDDIKNREGLIREEIIKTIKQEKSRKENICDHKEFIFGRQSVDLRVLLSYNIDDLRALCEVHGCSEGGSRSKMTVEIMKKLHPSLDRRINEELIRKMIKRNNKRFRFWKNIGDAIQRAKKPKGIPLIDKSECIEIPENEKRRG